jgi:hypothetical protein
MFFRVRLFYLGSGLLQSKSFDRKHFSQEILPMKPSRFDIFCSVMIALVSILSALTAWRANATSIQVGNAEFDGLSTSIRAQEAHVNNSVLAYEHYRAFTTFYRYNALGDKLLGNPEIDDQRERSELWGLANGLQYNFFNSLYLNQDGTNYDVQREIDELAAEANLTGDLNYLLHYETADAYRVKGDYLTLSLVVFAISFFMFAVGQAIRNSIRYLFALVGSAALIGGVCIVLALEFSV